MKRLIKMGISASMLELKEVVSLVKTRGLPGGS